MQRNDAAGPEEPNHLRNQLLRFRHVDQDQARGRQVERSRRQTRAPSIGVEDVDVVQMTPSDELLSALHLLGTPFDSDYPSCSTDARGKKIQTAARAAADLDSVGTVAKADLIEEPLRLRGKLERLSFQAVLLCLPVAQQVWIGFVHSAGMMGWIGLGFKFACGVTSGLLGRP